MAPQRDPAVPTPEAAQQPPRAALRMGMALATVAGAVAVAAVMFSLIPLRLPPASVASPVPSAETPSVSPTATSASPMATNSPTPSTVAAPQIDLSQIPWYTLVSVAFGSFTEQQPDDPPLPDPYDQLTVGTLDGEVTAQLRLSTQVSEDGQEGTWANGPYGSEVLVGEDDGRQSRLFLVSALDGHEQPVYEAADAVVIGSLDETRTQLYFVPIDRDSGLDRGLWRISVAGGEADMVVEGPLSETPTDFASQWTMDWSAGGDVLVTQACRMRSCRTLVHELESGDSRVDNGGSRIIGLTDGAYVTDAGIVSLADGKREPLPRPLGAQGAISGVPGAWYLVTEPGQPDARAYALEASPLTGGSVRTLVEVGAQDPTQATLRIGPDHGASVPAGWVLRWPTEGSRYMDISVPPHVWYSGELVNVVTGERLAVQPTNWPDTPTECAPIAPAALPSGAVPGEPITTPGGHYLWTTWGEDEDQVVQVVGGWLFGVPEPGESGEFGGKVTVRGHPRRVMPMGSVDGPWAIAWEEDGCRYEVQLAPGGTQAEAVAYAGRYSAPTPTADDERLVDAIIQFARSPSPVGREAIPFADDGVWLASRSSS